VQGYELHTLDAFTWAPYVLVVYRRRRLPRGAESINILFLFIVFLLSYPRKGPRENMEECRREGGDEGARLAVLSLSRALSLSVSLCGL